MKAAKPTVRLDFCDFWPGYRKTDNFFYHLLRRRFNVEITDQPEFLIYSDPGSHLHRLHHCTKIYFGIESHLPDWRQCDYALTCHYLEDPRHLRLPFYALYGGPDALRKDDEDFEKIFASKTRFCGFVVSNAGNRAVQKRIQFFHRLSRYKRVDSGGRALNNIGGPLPDGPAGKLAFLRECKFNIAFENAAIPGYTTEKIYEAMQARALPIYWGSPRIGEEFNTASFLNYADFPSEDALVERIIELDCDDAQYLEMLRRPYLNPGRPNEYFDSGRILNFFEQIFSARTTPVARRRKFFSFGRWTLVKRNKGF
ncbi:MAG TPA: glycosyltransferase family 10 [Clostridia bacterium]|nr:glycosyltransferase family 10 [Clostridia bacterium]